MAVLYIPRLAIPSEECEAIARVLQEFLDSPEGKHVCEQIDPGEKVEIFSWRSVGTVGRVWAFCNYVNGGFEIQSNTEYGNSSYFVDRLRAELPDVVHHLITYGRFSPEQVIPAVRLCLELGAE